MCVWHHAAFISVAGLVSSDHCKGGGGAKFTLKDVVFEMYTCSEGIAMSASLPVQPIEKIGHVYTLLMLQSKVPNSSSLGCETKTLHKPAGECCS